MKTMYPLGHHYNGFVAIYVLGYMMYYYTMLVPMNQKNAQKAKQEAKYKFSQVIYDTKSPQSCRSMMSVIYHEIMKTICSPCYHYSRFVVTHIQEHMVYNYTLLVLMNQKSIQEGSREHNIDG